MSNDNTIYELDPKLWDYLQNDSSKTQKGHLKVTAMIGDENGNIQWAIFFGNTGNRINGDADLVHPSVKNYGDTHRMEWQNERPVWLIPISKAAWDETFHQLETGNTRYLPKVSGESIVIRNPGKAGNCNYDFW